VGKSRRPLVLRGTSTGAERGTLGVIGEAQLAGFALGALREQSSEPFLDPIACCRWRRDDERAMAVDRD
jgi:hypothetical protein